MQNLGSHFPVRTRKGRRFLLAFFWCFGLVCGVVTSLAAGSQFVSLMRSASWHMLSFVGLLHSFLLPFLICLFAVAFSGPGLLVLVCFFKAFLFSYASMAVCLSFGSGGWLVRLLLLFSDCLSVPILYWYCLQRVSERTEDAFMHGVLACFLGILIGCIDFGIIMPFLGRLIDF